MLSFLRSFSKSPLGLGVFALIIIAFVVTLYQGGSHLGGMATGIGDGVASVGSAEITEAEIARRAQNQLDGERQQNPTITMPAFLTAGGLERTVDLTVSGRALEIFAGQQGMIASKKLVDGAIASIPAFSGPTGKFDQTTFQQVLQQRKISEAMLREDFGREALTKALAIPIAGAARVPAGLVQPYASLLLETREGQVATIPTAAFLPKSPPSDAEIQSFYQRNVARYTVPERRVVRYAMFDKERVAAQAQATDAEIQAVYAAESATYGAREKRTFTQLIVPTLAQANDLMAKVRGGMSMAEAGATLKREALNVAATDQKGFEQLTGPKVAAAAFAAKQGEVAAIERSGLGFHVVRVDALQSITATPLSAVRAKIAAELTAQKEAKAIANLVAEIEDAASNNATFDEVIKKFTLTAEVTPPLTTTGRAFDVPAYVPPAAVTAVLAGAFQAEPDDDPSVAALPQNAGYVFWKLDRTVPAAPQPLAGLRDQVIADVQTDKGSKAAKAAADAVVAAVNAGTPLAQAIAKAGVPLPAPQPAKARRLEVAQAQGRVPPPLTLLFSIPEKRARSLQMDERGGWYVVAVTKIISGDARTVPSLIQATQEQLSGVIGDEYVQQFAAAVRAVVGVKKNPAAIARVKRTLTGGSTR